MKSVSVLFLFALLLTACASTGGHRLVREERYDFGEPRDCWIHEYEDSELVAFTQILYLEDHIDTIYQVFQTNQVGDIIEQVTYLTRITKDGVKKEKYVSNSDGTHFDYILDGDEWVELIPEVEDSTFYVPGVYFDSIIYTFDSLQAIRLQIYREANASDIIKSMRILRYDDKGRIISDQGCDPDETDDEYPPFRNYTYRYSKRKMIKTQRYYMYNKGEYSETSCFEFKHVYNKLGLDKKVVKYQISNGRRLRDEILKYKYDRKTGDPLKLTIYSYYGYLFPVQSHKTIWTYE